MHKKNTNIVIGKIGLKSNTGSFYGILSVCAMAPSHGQTTAVHPRTVRRLLMNYGKRRTLATHLFVYNTKDRFA